jgi:hypothetical protein
MPVTSSFDPEKKIATLSVSGTIVLSEAIEVTEGLYRDPSFQEPTRVLWDLREGRFKWTTDEIKTFADFVQRGRGPGRGRAAILTYTDLEFGQGQMLRVYTEDTSVEVKVWRDYTEARNWLLEEF